MSSKVPILFFQHVLLCVDLLPPPDGVDGAGAPLRRPQTHGGGAALRGQHQLQLREEGAGGRRQVRLGMAMPSSNSY